MITHLAAGGEARMVDVGTKRSSRRRAVAEGRVRFGARAFRLLSENRLGKGDATAVTRIAGIQAAKRTSEWIPLCHHVPLDHVDVVVDLVPARREAVVRAITGARSTTGVEMEALVAVAAACLTLYDMAKSVDRGAVVEEIRLLEKAGGRSGTWRAGPRRLG